MNVVLGGSGTGKSRMLDEMKGLLCEAAKQSKQEELVERMESAYVFRLTFENGACAPGVLPDFGAPEFDVSYRMLHQLAKDRAPWWQFVERLRQSYSSLVLTMGTVIELLATLEKIERVKNMTVILCVDDVDKLENNGTMRCDFYRILTAILRFLVSSRAFVVCVCSTSAQRAIGVVLSRASHKHIYLIPPALRGQDVLKPRTRLERLLVDDMGGHGRALETLGGILRQYSKDELEQADPASVLETVCSQLRLQYGDLFALPFFQDPVNCQAVLAAVLSRRRYGVFERVASDMTVDRLRSFGLFRRGRDGHLECAFVLLVMLLRTLVTPNGASMSFNEHLTRTVVGWQPLEQLVAFHRRVKSMVFRGAPVELSAFHAGARFGPSGGILIEELQPRTVAESTAHHDPDEGSEMDASVLDGARAAMRTRIQLTTGSERVACNEVIQCKLMQRDQTMNGAQYEEERAQAVSGNTDVFLLVTTSDDVADPFDLPARCGIVSKGEFDEYFGAFASRGYRSLLDPQNTTRHERRLANATKVAAERKKRRFSSGEGAVNRLFKSKKSKTAEVLAEFCEH